MDKSKDAYGACLRTRAEQEALRERMVRGDEAARHELFDSILPLVQTWAAKYYVKRDWAWNDDVRQQAFLKAYQVLPKWDPARGMISTFITNVLIRSLPRFAAERSAVRVPAESAMKMIKAGKTPPSCRVGLGGYDAPENRIDRDPEIVERAELISDSMVDLTAKQLEAVGGRFYAGQTYAAVAGDSGFGARAMKQRGREGLHRLAGAYATRKSLLRVQQSTLQSSTAARCGDT